MNMVTSEQFEIPNPNAALSDVTNLSLREELADSLVGGAEEPEEPEVENPVQEHEFPEFELGDDEADLKKLGLEQDDDTEAQPEAEAQETEGPEGFETMEAAVEAYGLVDEEVMQTAKQSLAEAVKEMGGNDGTLADVNFEAYGNFMGKLSYAATTGVLMAAGDWQQRGNVPPETAQQATREVLAFLGHDTRLIGQPGPLENVNSQAVAQVIWEGGYNLVRTAMERGAFDSQQVNDPETAVYWLQALSNAMGFPGEQIEPAQAVKIVDRFARPILRNVEKLLAAQTREASPRRQSKSKQAELDDDLAEGYELYQKWGTGGFSE